MIGRILVTFVSVASLFICPVRADTEGSKRVLGPYVKDLEIGRGMNAANRDLRGTEIVGQDLLGANFDGCLFAAARFFDCNMIGVSFKGADLSGVKMSDCKILGADFTDAIINNIIGTGGSDRHNLNFTRSQIQSTRSFQEKDLSHCVIGAPALNLRGFDLSNAYISGDKDTLLDGATITNAEFYGSFDFEQFRRTLDVQRGRFPCRCTPYGHCDMSGLVLKEATIHFEGCTSINLMDTDIDECTLSFRRIDREMVAQALYSTKNYKRGIFYRTVINRANLSGFNFDRMQLIHSLPGNDLTNATFHDTAILLYRFSSSVPITAKQVMQTWNYKHNRLYQLQDDLKAEIEQLEQKASAE